LRICARILASNSSSRAASSPVADFRTIAVRMFPGAMAFTRTSQCARSIAAHLVNWMTAAFDAR
jgi:hypothetical protein